MPDLTLHTILNHIAYVNRAAAHSDSGLAPTPAHPTPASRKRQVTIVLRVTYATAILGLILCIAYLFQLYGPYGKNIYEIISFTQHLMSLYTLVRSHNPFWA